MEAKLSESFVDRRFAKPAISFRPPSISPSRQGDMFNYSTNFYRTKAINVIDAHDPAVPLFLYLPFQAVHDPFSDIREGADGPNPQFFVPADMQVRLCPLARLEMLLFPCICSHPGTLTPPYGHAGAPVGPPGNAPCVCRAPHIQAHQPSPPLMAGAPLPRLEHPFIPSYPGTSTPPGPHRHALLKKSWARRGASTHTRWLFWTMR